MGLHQSALRSSRRCEPQYVEPCESERLLAAAHAQMPERTYRPRYKHQGDWNYQIDWVGSIARSVQGTNRDITRHHRQQRQLKDQIQDLDDTERGLKTWRNPTTEDRKSLLNWRRELIETRINELQLDLNRLKDRVDEFINAIAFKKAHRVPSADSQTSSLDELDVAVLDVIAELEFVYPRRQGFLDSLPDKYRDKDSRETARLCTEARLTELKHKTRRIDEAIKKGTRPEDIPYTSFEDFSMIANQTGESASRARLSKDLTAMALRRASVTKEAEELNRMINSTARMIAVDEESANPLDNNNHNTAGVHLAESDDAVLVETHLVELRRQKALLNEKWKDWNARRVKREKNATYKKELQAQSDMEDEEEDFESRVARILRILARVPELYGVYT